MDQYYRTHAEVWTENKTNIILEDQFKLISKKIIKHKTYYNIF